MLSDYIDRIQELVKIAEEDEEILEVNDFSLVGFIGFMRRYNVTKKPALVLPDSGNFRVVWRSKDPSYNIGLEFLDSRRILYVLFNGKRRVSNIGDVADIFAILESMKLEQYLYEENKNAT